MCTAAVVSVFALGVLLGGGGVAFVLMTAHYHPEK